MGAGTHRKSLYLPLNFGVSPSIWRPGTATDGAERQELPLRGWEEMGANTKKNVAMSSEIKALNLQPGFPFPVTKTRGGSDMSHVWSQGTHVTIITAALCAVAKHWERK